MQCNQYISDDFISYEGFNRKKFFVFLNVNIGKHAG